MTPGQALQMQLDKMGSAVDAAAKAWVRATLERLKKEAEATWPDHPPRHPYGRDRSIKQFKIEIASNGLSGRLYNEADYSGYVEAGYTRKGIATAHPWINRGEKNYIYGHVLTQDLETELRNDFIQRISGATHG